MKTWIWIILALFAVLVAFAAWMGPSANYDDLWYMTDVRTFLDQGRMFTSLVFPMELEVEPCNPPPVLHNLPLMMPVYPLAKLFGVYSGWILVNLFYLLASVLLMVIMLRWSGAENGPVAAAVLLLLSFPVSLHVAAHPLAEAGCVFSTMILSAAWLIMREGPAKSVTVGLLGGIAALNRIPFLLLPLLMAGRTLSDRERTRGQVWRDAGIMAGSALLVWWFGHALFPQVDLGILPGVFQNSPDPMYHFYHPVPLSIRAFFGKLLESFTLQVTGRSLGQFPVALLMNLLILRVLLVRPRRNDPTRRAVRFLVLANLLVYAGSAATFRYQTRFFEALLPFLLMEVTLNPPRWPVVRLRIAVAVICGVGMAGTLYYAVHNRQDGQRTARMIAAYRTLAGQETLPVRLLVENQKLIAAWALPEPERILAVTSDFTAEELLRLHGRIRFEAMICRDDSPIPGRLASLNPVPVRTLPAPLDYLILYRLPERNQP